MFYIFLFSIYFPQSCENLNEDDIPIIIFHGTISSTYRVKSLTNAIKSEFPNRRVYSMEVWAGFLSSFVGRGSNYLRKFEANMLKHFAGVPCIDMIGHSQGGLIIRAYLQLYAGNNQHPNVRRLFSLAGVQGGQYCYWNCKELAPGIIAPAIRWLVDHNSFYLGIGASLIIPSSYWKETFRYTDYIESDSILAIINGEKHAGYAPGRDKLIDLEYFITYYSENDKIISPFVSEIFGFYVNSEDEYGPVYDYLLNPLYLNDTVGLRTMHDNGQWIIVNASDFEHKQFVEARGVQFYEKYLRNFLCVDPQKKWICQRPKRFSSETNQNFDNTIGKDDIINKAQLTEIMVQNGSQ